MAVMTPRFLLIGGGGGGNPGGAGGAGGAGDGVGTEEALEMDLSGFGARSRTPGRIDASP